MKPIVLHNTSFRMTIFMLHFGETLKTRFLKSCTYDCSALKKYATVQFSGDVLSAETLAAVLATKRPGWLRDLGHFARASVRLYRCQIRDVNHLKQRLCRMIHKWRRFHSVSLTEQSASGDSVYITVSAKKADTLNNTKRLHKTVRLSAHKKQAHTVVLLVTELFDSV